MKGSAKLFIASIIVFACSLGFFAGALCFGCNKMPMPCERGMTPPPTQGMEAPDMRGHHPDMKGPGKHGPRMGGPEHHKGPNPDVMDSILQVTPEQKVQLKEHREAMDSSFKALRHQKMEAEKALRDALDSNNSEQIAKAKSQLVAIQEDMLNLRISGTQKISYILSKEQMVKFRDFHKEQFKHHKKFDKKFDKDFD